MRRDLHAMEIICYRGRQEKEKSQAPQLEAVRRQVISIIIIDWTMGKHTMSKLDNLDKLFVYWSFLFQIVLIFHFAFRKWLFESYTPKYGWLVYALCIPGAVISLVLLLGGKSCYFWLGGFLFVIYASYGYWIDYVKQIQWRNPLQLTIAFPYIFLYLSTVMFYWWPLARLSRPLWVAYTFLFIIATILNITSH